MAARKRHCFYIDGTQSAVSTTNIPSAPAAIDINLWGTNSTSFGGDQTLDVARYMYVNGVTYTPASASASVGLLESLTTTDALQASFNGNPALLESLTTRDALEASFNGNPALLETLHTFDSLQVSFDGMPQLFESHVTSDSLSVNANGNPMLLESLTTSDSLVVSSTLATPSCSPGTATYANPQSVPCTLPAGATGCYTLNGTPPSASVPGTCDVGSTTYSGAIAIASNLANQLQILATRAGALNSAIFSAQYTFTAGNVSCAPGSGDFFDSVTLTCSTATTGASIYWIRNGTPACPATGTLYSGPFAVTESGTYQFIACESNFNPSAVSEYIYNVQSSRPWSRSGPVY